MSAAQGWQLADWFIKSIDPLLIIKGNHDAWSGHGDPLEYIKTAGSLYEKWKAIVELGWPNGRTAVLDCAHDHVGTSQFHPLHGQVRQARFNRSGINADLYITGHRHTWGLMTTEMQGRVVWMCSARGFKDHGDQETVKGFEIQKLGYTITAIFDPNAITETGFISCFEESEEAAEFLTYKRGGQSTDTPSRQAVVCLQSEQIRSPMPLDWNEREHIKHFLIPGRRFSAGGFLVEYLGICWRHRQFHLSVALSPIYCDNLVQIEAAEFLTYKQGR